MKILINTVIGGFGFSDEALQLMHDAGIKGIEKTNTPGVDEKHQMIWCDPFTFERTDLAAIEIVERIGSERASGEYCILEVAEIPDDVKRWDIFTHDSGYEDLIYGDYKWYDKD